MANGYGENLPVDYITRTHTDISASESGLRYRCRLPVGSDSTHLRHRSTTDLLHSRGHPLRLGLRPLHPLVWSIWSIRFDVHSRKAGDGCRNPKDEECSLG